jgi:group I intron endonuclease
MGTLYIAINKKNSKTYIGKTECSFKKRLKEHRQDAKHCRNNSIFHKAIRKYGIECFEFINIDLPNEDLNEAEQMFIQDYRDAGITIYNLTDGGEGQSGLVMSKEQREKISKAMMGNTPWNKGKKRPDMVGGKHPKAKAIVVKTPEGYLKEFRCIKDACDEYGLFRSAMSLVANGKQKQSKGYKCWFKGE